MFPYIKEIQKRNIDIGQGQSRVGVLDLGSGWVSWHKKGRWKRQEECQKVWRNQWNVHEKDEGGWTELSGPVQFLPFYTTTSSSSTSSFRSFSSTNTQTQLLQEADVISLVELNLSWRRQKLYQSTFRLTDQHGGRQDGSCPVWFSTYFHIKHLEHWFFLHLNPALLTSMDTVLCVLAAHVTPLADLCITDSQVYHRWDMSRGDDSAYLSNTCFCYLR